MVRRQRKPDITYIPYKSYSRYTWGGTARPLHLLALLTTLTAGTDTDRRAPVKTPVARRCDVRASVARACAAAPALPRSIGPRRRHHRADTRPCCTIRPGRNLQYKIKHTTNLHPRAAPPPRWRPGRRAVQASITAAVLLACALAARLTPRGATYVVPRCTSTRIALLGVERGGRGAPQCAVPRAPYALRRARWWWPAAGARGAASARTCARSAAGGALRGASAASRRSAALGSPCPSCNAALPTRLPRPVRFVRNVRNVRSGRGCECKSAAGCAHPRARRATQICQRV